MVIGAMDLLLGAETGNCSFAVLPTTNERTMVLELIFVLEAIAAPHLHADRFLPPTPVRVVVSHKLEGGQRSLLRPNVGTKTSERFALQTV
jgi:ATP-dependent helicase HepA